MKEQLTRLDIQAPEEAYEEVTGLLALMVSIGWEEQSLPSGDTLFRVHSPNAGLVESVRQAVAAAAPMAELAVEQVEVEDWVNSWKEFFTPVPCGSRFVVLPPWLADAAPRDHPGRTAIVIEPKSAFGTGHHTTTALCLAALSDLLDAGRIGEGQSFLDLGMGSGVLGLGLALSGLAGEGWDIDPLSVDNAVENLAANGVDASRFAPGLGSVEKLAGRRFDVVVANILARPLIEMAPEVAAAVKPGGVLVLSGILDIQAGGVAEAYMARGMGEPEKRISGEWACLVWR